MTTDEAIEDIARLLFAYEPGRRTTREVTADLTRAIVRWAVEQGWSARTEARVEVPGASVGRLGFVDVVVSSGEGQPGLAIEIDSADKPWSLTKLRHAAAAGMRPVWVRWGDEVLALESPDVDVIQLSATRRPSAPAPETQLGLWP